MERARPPADIQPVDFFTRWVPNAVACDPERQRKLGDTDAVIEFKLSGEAGGCFTIRVAGGTVKGCSGPAEQADLRVELDVETWRALNSGELSAPHALRTRKLRFEGSFLLGLKLHLLLG